MSTRYAPVGPSIWGSPMFSGEAMGTAEISPPDPDRRDGRVTQFWTVLLGKAQREGVRPHGKKSSFFSFPADLKCRIPLQMGK